MEMEYTGWYIRAWRSAAILFRGCPAQHKKRGNMTAPPEILRRKKIMERRGRILFTPHTMKNFCSFRLSMVFCRRVPCHAPFEKWRDPVCAIAPPLFIMTLET